jgi:hypothetical protein
MRKNIELVYFNAGGGHRSAALALREVIEQKHLEWDVSLVNLFEVIDSERYFQKLTGFAPEDLYNLRLKKGWTRGLDYIEMYYNPIRRHSNNDHLSPVKNEQQFNQTQASV